MGGTAENVWTGINDIGKNDVYVYDSSNETVEMNMHWYPLQPDNTTEEIYVSVQFPEVSIWIENLNTLLLSFVKRSDTFPWFNLRAFQRFYQKFMETAYPVEDIYL